MSLPPKAVAQQPQIPPENSPVGMFHTFQGVTVRKPTGPTKISKKVQAKTPIKRIITPHACAECKRRKIRCDGNKPCGQCLSGKNQKKCVYDKHRQRIIPSKRALESLSQALDEHRTVLNRLFPNHDIRSLLSLSREKLLDQLKSLPSELESESEQTHKYRLVASTSTKTSNSHSPQVPNTILNADTCGISSHNSQSVSRYIEPCLAVSSIRESISIMAKVRPTVRDLLSVCPGYLELLSVYPTIDQIQRMDLHAITSAHPWGEPVLIDAYFSCAHKLIPMIDEQEFRSFCISGTRIDDPWKCLYNIVLAVGCLFVSNTDDTQHLIYYSRAMSCLDIDNLSHGAYETIHVLAITGGFYLPYINKPAMAGSFLGAAIRMARNMALDTESPSSPVSGTTASISDTRRRTWLSLLSLNSWILTSPSHSEYYSPEILFVGLDENKCETQQNTESRVLVDNIKLSNVASRIYTFTSTSVADNMSECQNLDQQLSGWFHQSSLMGVVSEPRPESLWTASHLLKWRYYSLKILLFRKRLFELAADDQNDLTDEDRFAVNKCHSTATSIIEELQHTSIQGQYLARMAACLLYDTVMVPLVSLFWHSTASDSSLWTSQVSTVISVLQQLQTWSTVARDGCDIIERLFIIAQENKYTFDSLSASVTNSRADYSPVSPNGSIITLPRNEQAAFSVQPSGNLFHDLNWMDSSQLWMAPAPQVALNRESRTVLASAPGFADCISPVTTAAFDTMSFQFSMSEL